MEGEEEELFDPLNVPVSIHCLLQLIIKYKLWIPEHKRVKSCYYET